MHPCAGLKGVQIGESLLYHLAIYIKSVFLSFLSAPVTFKCSSIVGISCFIRDFKIQQRGRQRERPKKQ